MENFGSRLDEAPCFIKFGQAYSFTGKGILFLVPVKVACKPPIFWVIHFLGHIVLFFVFCIGIGKGLYQALLAIEEIYQANDTVKSRLLDRQEHTYLHLLVRLEAMGLPVLRWRFYSPLGQTPWVSSLITGKRHYLGFVLEGRFFALHFFISLFPNNQLPSME
jgi:hypothetical protein